MSADDTARALWWAVAASGLRHGVNPGMGWPLAVSAALTDRRSLSESWFNRDHVRAFSLIAVGAISRFSPQRGP